MTVVSAWSKVSDLRNGELWVYPGETGEKVVVRVVTGEKVIDWSLAPDEAEMLMAVLKKVADKETRAEPSSELAEAQSPEEAQEDAPEVFVRQEAPAAPASVGSSIKDDFKRLAEKLKP